MSSALSLLTNRLTVHAKLYLSVTAFTNMFTTVTANTLFHFRHFYKVNLHGSLHVYLLCIWLSFRPSLSLSLSLCLSLLFSAFRLSVGPSVCDLVHCVRNVVAQGDAQEGKWRGNWRMEWVASTLTRPRNVMYPALLTLMRTSRLPAVDWTDSLAGLHGHVRLGERRNVVSARLPSGSARALLPLSETTPIR